jgi:ligand-binding sensor domain-containing protein
LLHILLFWVYLPGTLLGQNLSFHRFTNQDGLPINNINDIVQDRDGFLWIATDAGLSRYDGYIFKTYTMDRTHEGSLPSNLVFRLGVDCSNKLWIMTTDRGLCLFDLNSPYVCNEHCIDFYPLINLVGKKRNLCENKITN